MGMVPPAGKGHKVDGGDWDWDEKKDMDAIREKLGWRGVADAHTWHDGGHEPPEKKEAYKLPHHKLRGESLVLSRRGVQRAMAALNGARGGTDMSYADRKRAYEHLKAHYEEMGEKVSEMKA